MKEKIEENRFGELILQLKELGGEDIEYVKWVIWDLEKGDIEAARNNCEQQRDKYDSKPEIRELLKKSLWEKGEDSPWPTPEEFKRKFVDQE